MKMTPAQVERTLSQLQAQAVPDDHPAVAELSELFGDHTFFLDSNGLNVIEPIEPGAPSRHSGKVVNIANWSDATLTSLAPHDPEATDVIVVLEVEH